MISTAIIAIVIPLVGWLLRKYLFEKKPLTKKEEIDNAIATGNEDAVNSLLDDAVGHSDTGVSDPPN